MDKLKKSKLIKIKGGCFLFCKTIKAVVQFTPEEYKFWNRHKIEMSRGFTTNKILLEASSEGYSNIVEYLIGIGADIRTLDGKGQTPLQLAAGIEAYEKFSWSKYNKDRNAKTIKVLLEEAKKLSKKGKLNFEDYINGNNKKDVRRQSKKPIELAVESGLDEVVSELVDSGVEIDDNIIRLSQVNNRGGERRKNTIQKCLQEAKKKQEKKSGFFKRKKYFLSFFNKVQLSGHNRRQIHVMPTDIHNKEQSTSRDQVSSAAGDSTSYFSQSGDTSPKPSSRSPRRKYTASNINEPKAFQQEEKRKLPAGRVIQVNNKKRSSEVEPENLSSIGNLNSYLSSELGEQGIKTCVLDVIGNSTELDLVKVMTNIK